MKTLDPFGLNKTGFLSLKIYESLTHFILGYLFFLLAEYENKEEITGGKNGSRYLPFFATVYSKFRYSYLIFLFKLEF